MEKFRLPDPKAKLTLASDILDVLSDNQRYLNLARGIECVKATLQARCTSARIISFTAKWELADLSRLAWQLSAETLERT